MKSWTEIAQFLSAFPETGQSDSEAREVVRCKGKVVAYPADNERSRPPDYTDGEEVVVIRIDYERRASLVAQFPNVFFVTPHYETYPAVIVRLSTVDSDILRDLLIDSWRFVAPKSLVKQWDKDATMENH